MGWRRLAVLSTSRVIVIITITAGRGYVVRWPPAVVVVAPGFIVVDPVDFAGPAVPARADEAPRQDGEHSRNEPDHWPLEDDLHFPTSLLSLSGHSSSPNGAPAGSATTATIPP